MLLASGAGYDSKIVQQHCVDEHDSDRNFCEDPGMIYRFIQSFRYDVDLPETSDPFRNPPIISGKLILVAPIFQGISTEPPLSMTSLSVFAIEGDDIAIPRFHARPLFDAISPQLDSEYTVVSGHHYAFIAPFPKWLTDQEEIPVAVDPEGFDRAVFLSDLNADIVSSFKDKD